MFKKKRRGGLPPKKKVVSIMWYILNENNEPVPADSFVAAQFLESGNRIIAQDDVDGAHLSTVFLCLDHNHYTGNSRRDPVLYESMWFGGPNDGDQRRYCTREEALAGHQEMLNEVIGNEVIGNEAAEAMHEAAEAIADKLLKKLFG